MKAQSDNSKAQGTGPSFAQTVHRDCICICMQCVCVFFHLYLAHCQYLQGAQKYLLEERGKGERKEGTKGETLIKITGYLFYPSDWQKMFLKVRCRKKHSDKLGRTVSTGDGFLKGNLTMSIRSKNERTFETRIPLR